MFRNDYFMNALLRDYCTNILQTLRDNMTYVLLNVLSFSMIYRELLHSIWKINDVFVAFPWSYTFKDYCNRCFHRIYYLTHSFSAVLCYLLIVVFIYRKMKNWKMAYRYNIEFCLCSGTMTEIYRFGPCKDYSLSIIHVISTICYVKVFMP